MNSRIFRLSGAALIEATVWTGFAAVFILSILSESLLSGAFTKTEPQMNADERRFVPGMCLKGRGAGSMRLAAQGKHFEVRGWDLCEMGAR